VASLRRVELEAAVDLQMERFGVVGREQLEGQIKARGVPGERQR
jgi:hypothetical protein